MPSYYNPYRTALSEAQMKTNAVWLRNYLQNRGWTLNAICACLGNWESECTLNPNRPQRSNWPTNSGGGFGLAQWTPWNKKYGAWCRSQGIGMVANDNNPAGRMEPQIEYHDHECAYGISGKKTWFNNHGYSYTWASFKTSHDNVEQLAAAYYWQYERSAANDPGSRPNNARKWWNYLSGQAYNPITSSIFPNSTYGSQMFGGSFRLQLLIFLILLILSNGGFRND